MNRLLHGLQHDLAQSLYEFRRIVKPRAHFKLRDAQPAHFFARLVINFTQRLHVIGDERHRHDANLASVFRGQIVQRAVQGRL